MPGIRCRAEIGSRARPEIAKALPTLGRCQKGLLGTACEEKHGRKMWSKELGGVSTGLEFGAHSRSALRFAFF